MAKNIILPTGKKPIIVKCYECKTMYVPEPQNTLKSGYFENCPICGNRGNQWHNRIPLWKYNLIRFFRGAWTEKESKAGV